MHRATLDQHITIGQLLRPSGLIGSREILLAQNVLLPKVINTFF